MVGRGVGVNLGVGVMVGVSVGMGVVVGETRCTSGSGKISSVLPNKLQAVEMKSRESPIINNAMRTIFTCGIPFFPMPCMPVIIL